MATWKPQATKVCSSGFFPPNKWKLTSPAFLADLALALAVDGTPVSQIVFRAIDDLLGCEATFHDFEGRPIDLFGEYKDGLDVIEWAFGGDWARGMRRLLERAERPFRNQMKATPKLLMRILLLHYAREIRKGQAAKSPTKTGADTT